MAQLTFCQRIKRRNARRRFMVAAAIELAGDDTTSRRLAERLAVAWRVKGTSTGVLESIRKDIRR